MVRWRGAGRGPGGHAHPPARRLLRPKPLNRKLLPRSVLDVEIEPGAKGGHWPPPGRLITTSSDRRGCRPGPVASSRHRPPAWPRAPRVPACQLRRPLPKRRPIGRATGRRPAGRGTSSQAFSSPAWVPSSISPLTRGGRASCRVRSGRCAYRRSVAATVAAVGCRNRGARMRRRLSRRSMSSSPAARFRPCAGRRRANCSPRRRPL